MKNQPFLDTVRVWLQTHALSISVTVVLTLVALKVAAVLNRKMFARMFKGKDDEDSKKLEHTLTRAVHWTVYDCHPGRGLERPAG